MRIEKVAANRIGKLRLIGDIGLRSFRQLYQRARDLLKNEAFDFIYIPIPSFYCALLGPILHKATGVRYGIDYIDPWVHTFPGSNIIGSRHWLSTKLSAMLEPLAVRKASLITGVAEGYYKPVLERNKKSLAHIVAGAMPYGGEREDHLASKKLNLAPYLFQKYHGKLQLVYAGAMLPKAYAVLTKIFSAISDNRTLFSDVEFHFIGTGSSLNNSPSFTIKPLAERYGLAETIVFEHPQRIPYLDVLTHLEGADAVFVLGSTEPHYTPSKIYQGVLSGKPILAVLHAESSASHVLKTTNAGMLLSFGSAEELPKIEKTFPLVFTQFRTFVEKFDPELIDLKEFEKFSAYTVTGKLAELLNKALMKSVS